MGVELAGNLAVARGDPAPQSSVLGERVEDTFLISGPELQVNKRQIQIETELLETLEGH